MKIKITDMMKTPGKAFEFAFEYFPEDLGASGEYIKFGNGLKVSANCVYTGESFRLTGAVKGSYMTVCDRCATDVGGGIDLKFDEEYSSRGDISHPDRYLFDGREIDLTKMIEDNILLEMPMRHLCKPDCKGLCPVCWCDLNTQACDCSLHQHRDDIKMKTPFSGLKKLMDDNKEV